MVDTDLVKVGPLNKISVVGLGKLGAPLAACFAHKGYTTVGVDSDAGVIEAMNEGRPPVHEPGLQELIQANRDHLLATVDYRKAVENSDVTFVVVPTPSEPQGGFSLRYVLGVMEQLGDALRKKSGYHLVVLTSTVMPGATEVEVKPRLEAQSGKRCGQDLGFCYSPEFVALGSVIRDFLHPDFVLIGESDPTSGALLEDLYQRICENQPPVARMSFIEAELAKLAVNTYVTSKISFANLLARICEQLPGARVDVVTSAVGLDSRIGRKYLKGAIGYGGPCFPRDVVALVTLARSLGVPAALPEATDTFNRHQVKWLESLVEKMLPKGGKVGILGLAYKPHSDVVEEAPGLLLAQALIRAGVEVVTYDPTAIQSAKRVLGSSVVFAASAQECVRKADLVVLSSPCEEFKQLSEAEFAPNPHPKILVDCWRLLEGMGRTRNLRYVPLGVGNSSLFYPEQ